MPHTAQDVMQKIYEEIPFSEKTQKLYHLIMAHQGICINLMTNFSNDEAVICKKARKVRELRKEINQLMDEEE